MAALINIVAMQDEELELETEEIEQFDEIDTDKTDIVLIAAIFAVV